MHEVKMHNKPFVRPGNIQIQIRRFCEQMKRMLRDQDWK